MNYYSASVAKIALWLLFVSFVLFLLSSCATTRPEPVTPLIGHSVGLPLDSLATLPPYLVPPPAGSSPRQVRRWQNAQREALKHSTKPDQVTVVDKSKVKVQQRTTVKDQSKVKDQSTTKDKSKQKPDHRDQSNTDNSTGVPGWQLITGLVAVLLTVLLFIFLARKNAKTIA